MFKIVLLTSTLATPAQMLAPLPGLEPMPPLPQQRTWIDNQGGMTTVQPTPGGGFTAIGPNGQMTIGTPGGMLIQSPPPQQPRR